MKSLSTLARPLAAAAASVALAGLASAQVLPWNQLSPSSPPSNRERTPLATDGTLVYAYGGQVSTTTSGFDELWSFDGTAWTLITPSGTGPGPRSGPGFAWDEARGKLVVFAGTGTGGVWGNRDNQTWEWDPANGWVQMTPVTSPDPHWLFNMVYVPGVGTVFHGGTAWDATGTAYKSGDTWAWDGTNWTKLSSAGPAHSNGKLIYRPGSHDLVLFGGDYGTGKTSDTWLYDIASNTWAQIVTATLPESSSTPGVPGLVYPAGYWDPVVGKVIIHGGQNTGTPSNKTWEFDGVDWTDVTPTTTKNRRNHDAVWVPALNRAITAFGSSGSATNETWERGVTALGTFTVQGTDCPTSGGSTATLSASTMPAIGQPLVVDFDNLTPGTLNFAVVGGSTSLYLGLPLPIPFSAILPGSGAGCNLQVSSDIDFKAIAVDVSGTSGSLTLPIPNDPTFVGLTAYVQGIQLELAGALTAANSAYGEIVVGQL